MPDMLNKNITKEGGMDKLRADFLIALREAVRRAGSQTELAKSAGMQQSRISDYLSERYELDNITIGTLRKLFPELEIRYFLSGINRTKDDIADAIESRLLTLFRRLETSDKVLCFEMMARTFGDKFSENIGNE